MSGKSTLLRSVRHQCRSCAGRRPGPRASAAPVAARPRRVDADPRLPANRTLALLCGDHAPAPADRAAQDGVPCSSCSTRSCMAPTPMTGGSVPRRWFAVSWSAEPSASSRRTILPWRGLPRPSRRAQPMSTSRTSSGRADVLRLPHASRRRAEEQRPGADARGRARGVGGHSIQGIALVFRDDLGGFCRSGEEEPDPVSRFERPMKALGALLASGFAVRSSRAIRASQVAWAGCLLLTGACAHSIVLTPQEPSATSQLLVVRSLDRAIAQLDLSQLGGRRVDVEPVAQAGNLAFAKEVVEERLRERGVHLSSDAPELKLIVLATVLGTIAARPWWALQPCRLRSSPYRHRRSLFSSGYAIADSWSSRWPSARPGSGELMAKLGPEIGRAKHDDFTILIAINFSVSDLDEPPERDRGHAANARCADSRTPCPRVSPRVCPSPLRSAAPGSDRRTQDQRPVPRPRRARWVAPYCALFRRPPSGGAASPP